MKVAGISYFIPCYVSMAVSRYVIVKVTIQSQYNESYVRVMKIVEKLLSRTF